MALPPPVLADRIQPGAVLIAIFGLAGFLWAKMRGMRSELKADIQGARSELKVEIQAGEDRQSRRTDALKDDLRECKDDLKEVKAGIKSLLLAQGLGSPAVAKV